VMKSSGKVDTLGLLVVVFLALLHVPLYCMFAFKRAWLKTDKMPGRTGISLLTARFRTASSAALLATATAVVSLFDQ
jgi:hypothetical protein